ncbi:MAG TPA: hypothetical protein VMY42_18075 [Thermoguttaceae bacterium]|nr:hypothetical protein [Thermoguttaceae bacterium]
MSEFVTEVSCRAKHEEVIAAIRDLERRLFRDNGHISIQTRIERHEQSLAMLCKIVYGSVGFTLLAVGGAVLALVIKG